MTERVTNKDVRTLEPVEPVRLMVVFRCERTGVKEDQHDHEPVERLRFDHSSTELTTSAVGSVKPATAGQPSTRGRSQTVHRHNNREINKQIIYKFLPRHNMITSEAVTAQVR